MENWAAANIRYAYVLKIVGFFFYSFMIEFFFPCQIHMKNVEGNWRGRMSQRTMSSLGLSLVGSCCIQGASYQNFFFSKIFSTKFTPFFLSVKQSKDFLFIHLTCLSYWYQREHPWYIFIHIFLKYIKFSILKGIVP